MAIQGNDGFWYNSQVDADASNPYGRVGDDRSSSSSKTMTTEYKPLFSDAEREEWHNRIKERSKEWAEELFKPLTALHELEAKAQEYHNAENYELEAKTLLKAILYMTDPKWDGFAERVHNEVGESVRATVDNVFARWKQALPMYCINTQIACINWADQLMDQKNYDTAITICNEAIKFGGKYIGKAYVKRGLCLIFKQNLEQAIADFKKGGEYGDDEAQFWYDVKNNQMTFDKYCDSAMAYLDEEKYQKAFSDITDAIKYGGKEAGQTYYVRGIIWEKIGNKDKAIEDFKTAYDYGVQKALEILNEYGINYTPKKVDPPSGPKTQWGTPLPLPPFDRSAFNSSLLLQASSSSAPKPQASSPAPQAQSSTPVKKTIKYDDGGVYDGDVSGNSRHGKGKLKYPNGAVYEGDFVNNDCHGKGTITFSDGGVYEGDWLKGDRTGKGKYTWADGSVYEGDWVNGNRHGKGKNISKDGGVYEGEWVDNKCHGKGKMTFASGTVQDGDWKDNNFIGGKTTQAQQQASSSEPQITDGIGTLKDKWGVYEGNLLRGKPHGKGKKTFLSGDVYEGDWQDGSRQGFGTLTESCGNKYEGDWRENRYHGRGKLTYKDGAVYEGEFTHSNYHGKGKITYPNGDIFEGDFTANEGKGSMTYANGKVQKGKMEGVKREFKKSLFG